MKKGAAAGPSFPQLRFASLVSLRSTAITARFEVASDVFRVLRVDHHVRTAVFALTRHNCCILEPLEELLAGTAFHFGMGLHEIKVTFLSIPAQERIRLVIP